MGEQRWRVYEVQCDGLTHYIEAVSHSRAKAFAFLAASYARGCTRNGRRDVFKGLRARLAASVPEWATVYRARDYDGGDTPDSESWASQEIPW
jgi:hypothetical protein